MSIARVSRNALVLTAAEHAELLAAARATVAAAELGAADPLVFVRHFLAAHGQLPPKGATPVRLLACTVVPNSHRVGVA